VQPLQQDRVDVAQHPRRQQSAKLVQLARRRQTPKIGQMSKTAPAALFGQKQAKQIGGTRRSQQQQKHRAQKLSRTPVCPTPTTPAGNDLLNLAIGDKGRQKLQQSRSASSW
jgi:hypothetical protein